MSEPTLICSAPELANSAQKIALYSHYATAVAGFAVGGVMIARSRVQEKLPHILGAVAAFGVGLAAMYSQWEFNQFLYQHREIAANAVAARTGLWAWWATLIFVGLAFLPGFKYKRMQKLALIPLIILSFLCFGLASAGEAMASAAMTLNVPADMIEEAATFKVGQKVLAMGSALMFGIPALVCGIGLIVTYVISQAKKVQKRSEDNLQDRTGLMALIAVALPAVIYSAGTFLVASNELGLDRAVLLFNCGDLMSMFFLLCATMSILGVPANFPKPVKPPKPEKPKKEKKSKKGEESPTESNPNMLDQQQAYAQAYAQQLYAQQQAYAQYYAQQQAAQQAQAQAAVPQQVPASPETQPQQPAQTAPQGAQTPDAAAMAAYQQQQAQYYAQQQAYAAYQQQQQAYQQAYAAQQQQYAPNQQQTYAQAYAQQQAGYQQQHRAVPTGTQPQRVAAPRPAGVAGVKKVGGVRPIKKIR